MKRQIIIQGELHIFPRDARSLLTEGEDADALFVEGRSDTVKLTKLSFGFFLYLLGYFTLEAFYAVAGWSSRLVGSGFDAKEKAQEMGLSVENEIDFEIHEMYEIASDNGLRVFYFGALFMLIFSVVRATSGGETWGIPHGLYALVIFVGAPFVYFFVTIVLSHWNASRDERMANSVRKISDEEGYQKVLLLVGDSHVEGIAKEFDSEGWSVHARNSTQIIGRITRAAFGLVPG